MNCSQKTLQSLKSCASVDDDLCGKSVLSSESPVTLMKDLNLLQYHVLFMILIYKIVNQIILCLKSYIETFYIDIILKQSKFKIFSYFIVEYLKWFLVLFSNENLCCISCFIQISSKINLLHYFWESIKVLLFAVVFEISIMQQTNRRRIVFLTSFEKKCFGLFSYYFLLVDKTFFPLIMTS